MESREEIARAQGILQQPEVFGHEVGFTDLTRLHGEWIWEMVFGKEDYTLQAHRGSYKSSCLAVAIALRMVIFRRENRRWDGTNSTVGDVLAGQPGARMIDNGDGTVTVVAGGVYPIPAGIGCTLA